MKHNFSRLFIPQEKNNFRADILKNSFLFLLVAFYLLNQTLVKYLSFVKPGVLGYSSEITTQKVLDQTNQQRSKLGLPSLKYNSLLSQSAAQIVNQTVTEPGLHKSVRLAVRQVLCMYSKVF